MVFFACAVLLFSCSDKHKVTVAELCLIDAAGKLRLALVLPDASFSHVFVHSINLSLVEEAYKLSTDGALELYRLIYADTSSGMPSEGESGFYTSDGFFVLDVARNFKELPIRVSPVPGHGIRTAESFFAFSDIFNAGDLVLLRGRVRRRNL